MPALQGIKVGRTVWYDGFEVIVHGKDEAGLPVARTEGPFRSRDDAERWTRKKYRGHRFDVTKTLVPDGTSWRRPPAKKPPKRRRA